MARPWYVDLYDKPTADGGNPNSRIHVATVEPENLRFLKQRGNEGPGTIDFEISLQALDAEGRRIVSHDFIGPYRSDFRLRRGGLTRPVMTGIVTTYGGAEAGEDHVKVSGKDYLHYLEIRDWPYDADLSYVNWPDGFRFKVAAAEIGQIVKDLLETVRDVSPNFPGPPGATEATRSYSLDFTVDCDSTGHNRNFEIAAFDSSSIYDLIRTLSEAERAQGGFEFLMGVDKVFRLRYPELGNPLKPVLTLEIEPDTRFTSMLSLSKTNTGPECTHVLGVGAGTSTRQGGVNRHFRKVSSRYRRIDKTADYGDVKNLDTLEDLTGSTLSFGANPVHEIPVAVDPNEEPGFWRKVFPGVFCTLKYDLGYSTLSSAVAHKIVSMDCTVDEDGNESVTLGLNAHYKAFESAGLDDW